MIEDKKFRDAANDINSEDLTPKQRRSIKAF
jgi:hypothetical protein